MVIYSLHRSFRNCKVNDCKSDDVRQLYAWSPGFPDVALPSDLGVKLGNNFKYVIIETHYHRAFEKSLRPAASLILGITQKK